MNSRFVLIPSLLLLLCQPALAAIQLVTPDGRQVQLNDDYTWEYLSPGSQQQNSESKEPFALLRVTHVNEAGKGACSIGVKLHNGLPYKIKNLAFRFAVYKSDSILYDNVTRSFSEIKSTDDQYREVLFRHIDCSEIHHIQVEGPGRCSMGDLDRFSSMPGDCIARVKIEPSKLVNIRK